MVTHPDPGDGQGTPRATGGLIWAVPGETRDRQEWIATDKRETDKGVENAR